MTGRWWCTRCARSQARSTTRGPVKPRAAPRCSSAGSAPNGCEDSREPDGSSSSRVFGAAADPARRAGVTVTPDDFGWLREAARSEADAPHPAAAPPGRAGFGAGCRRAAARRTLPRLGARARRTGPASLHLPHRRESPALVDAVAALPGATARARRSSCRARARGQPGRAGATHAPSSAVTTLRVVLEGTGARSTPGGFPQSAPAEERRDDAPRGGRGDPRARRIARGSSQEPPRVGGVPLIVRAIETAQATWGSTGWSSPPTTRRSPGLARAYGAEVVMRPAGSRATPRAPNRPSITPSTCLGAGVDFAVIVFIQATSPFIDPADIDDAISRVERGHGRCGVLGGPVVGLPLAAGRRRRIVAGVNHDPSSAPPPGPRTRVSRDRRVLRARRRRLRAPRHRVLRQDRGGHRRRVAARSRSTPRSSCSWRAPSPPSIDPATPAIDVDAVVTDFDGVHTDDRVLLSEDGTEHVVVEPLRRDGGRPGLRRAGIPVLILSTERNPRRRRPRAQARRRGAARPRRQGVGTGAVGGRRRHPARADRVPRQRRQRPRMPGAGGLAGRHARGAIRSCTPPPASCSTRPGGRRAPSENSQSAVLAARTTTAEHDPTREDTRA